MRDTNTPRTIMLVSAIALGCVSATVDAYARSGVGGAGGRGIGHAAPSGGFASSHASSAPRGAPAGGASQGHAFDSSSFVHVGHGFVPD
jgi:hypothetical protein